MREEMVIALKEANELKLVGGKASALSKLMRAGFNVPDGFVITTQAFQKMNSALESQIYKYFNQLGVKYVAVRSSAVAEDSSNASWAGQLDTFLNVSRANLVEKVQKCWDSTKSERAQAYAEQKGSQTGSVAVIVQIMIQGEVSGVAFSVHPVTKKHNHMVIEAVSGLGEALVSGNVTPDSYVVDKKSGKIFKKLLSKHQRPLSPKQIKKLAGTVNKLEGYFGFPVDVEWGFTNNKLLIMQCRPITTLG